MTTLCDVTEQPDQPAHLDLRASDADRERVARILHDAMAEGRLTIDELDERLQQTYSSKTLGDLVPITSDLPITAATIIPPAARLQDAVPTNRIGGIPSGQNSFAMLSGFQRRGVWVVPRFYNVFVFMGGGELDLTEARFAEAESTIQVVAFMGGVEIIVPDDITVRVTGFGFMGDFSHRGAHEGPAGSPLVTISGLAFMGGVDVRPPKRKKLKDRSDRTPDQLGP
jgi:hypothetical protein